MDRLAKLLGALETIGIAANPIALLGRVLMAAFFIHEGVDQIADVAGTMSYMAGFGVWPGFLPLVILAELGGGLAVLIGFLTRPTAIGLAVFTLLTALFFHKDFSDPDQVIHFQKNVTMAGGFLILAAFGPGAWSIDGWIARRGGAKG